MWWRSGRAFTKSCMPPRRCLLSWSGGRTLPRRCVPSWLCWQRRWSLGGCGPGSGPADVLGKGLAGAPARVLPWHCGRPRQGSCRRSRGFPWQGSCRGSLSSGPYLILCVYDLYEDLHAPMEVPPEPWFQCGRWCWNPWAQGWRLSWCRASCPNKGLAEAAEAAPARA